MSRGQRMSICQYQIGSIYNIWLRKAVSLAGILFQGPNSPAKRSYMQIIWPCLVLTWPYGLSTSMCKWLMLYLTQPYASNKIYIGKYGKIWSFGSKKRKFSHFYGKEKNLQTELKVCCSQWPKVARSEKKKIFFRRANPFRGQNSATWADYRFAK